MHYDLEVSGFPSSHAGHIILLNLKQQDYPGTKTIEGAAYVGPADLPLGQIAGRDCRVCAFRLGAASLRQGTADLPDAGLRRDRRQRIHR